jgi:predicted glutamine amidotransferase
MCKLFSIVEIENQKKAEKFAHLAIPSVTKTDNHGLGIMRLGENGVHVQRWLEPPTVMRRKQSKALRKYDKALLHQQNEAGIPSRNLYALAIHGRFATCARNLENVHPFVKDGTALMHNGVITNAHEFERSVSTCDSEAILSQYNKHGVKADNNKLTEALDGMSGYQAAMVFNDNGIIDVWRDASATLFIAHVRGVGVVIATTAEIITTTAKRCKAYITGLDEILPYTVIRWTNGVSPQIGGFDCVQPALASYTDYPTWPPEKGSLEVIERHKTSVSEANGFYDVEDVDNPYQKEVEAETHWWNIDDDEKRQAAYNKEAQRNSSVVRGKHLAKHYQEEIDEEDKRYLEHLQDMKRGGNK